MGRNRSNRHQNKDHRSVNRFERGIAGGAIGAFFGGPVGLAAGAIIGAATGGKTLECGHCGATARVFKSGPKRSQYKCTNQNN